MSVLDLFRLDGKVAVVTGGSSGLGADFAVRLAEAGADVVVGARRLDRLQQTVEAAQATGRRALAVSTDVTDPDSCEALVAAAVAEFGQVDYLVNNAGVAATAPATREKPEHFRGIVDINLNGAYWMAQACGRVMRPGSSIVNISSMLGITTARLPHAAYSATKAALMGLTRDLASQWTGRRGIRVNALAPGFFPSEMSDHYSREYLAEQAPRMLVGRLGKPIELSATLIWLLSDAAGYVTGQTVVVDGGVSIT